MNFGAAVNGEGAASIPGTSSSIFATMPGPQAHARSPGFLCWAWVVGWLSMGCGKVHLDENAIWHYDESK